MQFLQPGALFVILAGGSVLATVRLGRRRNKIRIFLPALICLLGAGVCYGLYEAPWLNFSYSVEYGIVSKGISFAAGFAAGVISAGLILLRGLLFPGGKGR